jgi:tetratricopeptide (TPR) repeat protein
MNSPWQLNESLGRWPRARNYLQSILDKEAENVRCLAFLANGLLARSEEPEEAERCIRALEKQLPNDWDTIRLRVLLLHSKKQDDKAVARITKYAEDKDASLLWAATLLEEIGQAKPAEAMYKQYEKKSARPESPLARAGFLGRMGRIDESLAIYDEVRTKVPAEQVPGVFVLALEVLYASNPEPRHLEQAENWFNEAYSASAGDKARRNGIRSAQAALRNLQGRFKDAEELYEVCLKENPRDVLAMNNLAWLLATKGEKPEQALAHIERAIEIAGPLTSLLDTRGIVRLAMGNVEQAILDLDEVALDQPTAVSFFHLAQAQHAAKKNKEATASLHRAVVELKLNEMKDLHPFEREKYKQLRTNLKVP